MKHSADDGLGERHVFDSQGIRVSDYYDILTIDTETGEAEILLRDSKGEFFTGPSGEEFATVKIILRAPLCVERRQR